MIGAASGTSFSALAKFRQQLAVLAFGSLKLGILSIGALGHLLKRSCAFRAIRLHGSVASVLQSWCDTVDRTQDIVKTHATDYDLPAVDLVR